MSSFDFNSLGQQPERMGSGSGSHSSPSPPAHGQQNDAQPRNSGHVTIYQTTGPDAHTGPLLGSSGAPVLNPRSCVTCRRRKVRCDKQMPCSNCRRALIPCVFPAPGRAPRQARPKDPNAPPKNSSQREIELTKRLRKLEGIVEELSTQIEVESSGKAASSAANSPADITSNGSGSIARQMSGNIDSYPPLSMSRENDATTEQSADSARKKTPSQNFGRLVGNDQKGSTRYVSSGFWSKLNDELDSIRTETQRLTDDESDYSDDGTPDGSPVTAGPSLYDHHGFILGYRSADVNLKQCHPLPSHVPFLWSVYQENVESLLKIFHVPTVDGIIREARKNSDKLSASEETLVFSIYFSAVISLEADEVETNLGASKDELLSRYRFALEQSLAKANFLNTSDFTILQAFTLFLTVVRRHDDSRFCWALTGLLIRIAMGIGLHRDGTNFKLNPYETEMRRRLWWAIMALDLRSAEELGTDITITDRSFDTQMPSNINDADISLKTTEYPVSLQGRSDMAVPLVRYEICSLSRQFLAAASAMPDVAPGVSIEAGFAEREQLLIDVYQRVEHKFLKHVVDEADPLYWVATMIARVIMAKMCLVIYQPMLFPGSEVELSDEIRQRIYVAAIEIIEYNQKLNTDERCKQYRWLFMTYTSWHAVAYVLIESCRRPWTALVERGWEAVDSFDKAPLDMAKTGDHVAVFLPLRKLFARCGRHRLAQIARLKANEDEARKLDFAERMNPAHARFGPVPGTENRMDEVRQKWRLMMRPNGASPLPAWNQRQRTPVPPQDTPGTSGPSSLQPPPQPQHATSSDGSLAVPMDLSHVAINYMEDMIMKQGSIDMTDLWPLNNDQHADKNMANLMASQGHPTAYPVPMPTHTDHELRQQALNQQMQPAKDDEPPYLWTDPFTSINTGYDDGSAGEDADMLGDEFDWQNWSQNIRGLEMESTQQPTRGW